MALSNFLTVSAIVVSCCAVCLSDAMHTRAEIDKENLKNLATANNYLALNIYRELVDGSLENENFFFSPFSLSVASGMLFYGTKGITAQESRLAFGYEKANLSSELVHETFHSLIESFRSTDESSYVLNWANAVLLNKRLYVVEFYKKEVENLYEASVKNVNFMYHTSEILEEINTWVKEKTNGKIEKLLQKLSTSTIFVLLNAIYFKGTWQKRFGSIYPMPSNFYNNGLESNRKLVPMMRLYNRFLYAAVFDLQAFELPYEEKDISLLVLLPKTRDGLKSLEESLTLEKLSTILQNLRWRIFYLTLPKFKIEYSENMSREFQAVGLKSIFNPGADFSGIMTAKKAYLSEILHKAVVEVNEEGTKAAAVTKYSGKRKSKRKTKYLVKRCGRPYMHRIFVIDHPFLFAILQRRSDTILYLGRVTSL